MHNSVNDLLILMYFGLRGHPPHALVIKSVVWSLPSSGWVKVNTDEAVFGSPSIWGCRGVFAIVARLLKVVLLLRLAQCSLLRLNYLRCR